MSKSVAVSRGSAATTFSMLGADTVITGNIEATVDLHIDGTITGDIACSSLVQGKDSAITGAIRAESVRIAGSVRGTIAARDVVILSSATIEGDVAYDSLTVEQGARIEGRLSPNGGQMPPAIAQGEVQIVATPA
ncbi:polymer-forming cytoskeletal protein [Novosphingobium sp. 1949]|uniref:Polymer-forming cytoskeletal protein n=1 Tax=Novosphingobium organovorum TaxID=2930092 RepID=A0ABT0BEZ7_9SPHN|nr:polymer-forming cytoskeletal protein [Novosphingobium organovorum]MCJ2183622.1 polymer-forming cytoskeletal protein [Novosphingobium organovorum]